MESKQQMILALDQVFHRWQELIASLSHEQIGQPLIPSQWTLKDVMAHLWAWQQGSVARASAALQGSDPDYPDWWRACGPDPEEEIDRTNAFIFAANKDKDWENVLKNWKEQFTHYLELLRQIPEADLMQKGRYPWMGTYALADSANGSLDHHLEHYEDLSAWLKEHAV